MYGFVGRLTGQKGIDVLFGALREALRWDACPLFVILGQGEKEKEDMIRALASKPSSAGRLVFVSRYDMHLAKLIYAASDFFLIPSEYEPCGLTDYIAQLSGSIPIVHRVGGLVKVRDGENGFCYEEQSAAALLAAIARTFRIFGSEPSLLEGIRRNAFAEIFARRTWDIVLASGYLPLYRRAIAGESWTRR
jgi:starch synthase